VVRVLLEVEIEAKDEWEGGAGRLPAPAEIATVAHDHLRDITRSEWELPWMVRSVKEVTR
jgi:hypothetical protein